MNLLFFFAKGKAFFSVDCPSLFSIGDQIFQNFFKKRVQRWQQQNSKSKIILALEARHPIEFLIFFQLSKVMNCDLLLLSPSRSVDDLASDCFRSLVGKQQVVLIVLSSCIGSKTRERRWRAQKKKMSSDGLFIDLVFSFQKLITDAWVEKKKSSFSNGHKDYFFCGEKKNILEKGRLLFFTSGSSSAPKLVVFEKKNIYNTITLQNENFPFASTDRWALTLPLHHVGGLSIVFRSLLSRGNVSFFCKHSDDETLKTFKKNSYGRNFISTLLELDYDKKPSLKALENAKTSHLSLSAYQLSHYVAPKKNGEVGGGVMDKKKREMFVNHCCQWSFLKLILVGGGPIPDWIWDMCEYEKQLRKKMAASLLPKKNQFSSLPVLRPTYGMSESFAQLATWNGLDKIKRLQLLKGRLVKKNKNNSLLINKSNCFSGYMVGGRVLQLRSKWWESDDLIKVHEAKSLSNAEKKNSCLPRLVVVGKKTNVVITGGENVSVEELEQKFLSSNFFSRLVILGLPHDAWGEEIVCLCAPKDNSLLERCGGKKSLIKKNFYQPFFEKVLSKIEKYKQPKKYFLWSGDKYFSASNPLNKIPRHHLKEQVLKGIFPLFFFVDN